MSSDEFEARWAPTLRTSQSDTEPLVHASLEDQAFTPANELWEDAVDAVGGHTGVMVAFFPTAAQQQQLAVEGGEPADDVHLTLVYLGEVGAELEPEDEARVIEAVTGWAQNQLPVRGGTNGHGIFTTGVTPVTFANVDIPLLPAARQALVEALQAADLPPLATHGYTPHMTLAYDERRDVQVPDLELYFDTVVIAFAGSHTRIPLGKPDTEISKYIDYVRDNQAEILAGGMQLYKETRDKVRQQSGQTVQYTRDQLTPTTTAIGTGMVTWSAGGNTYTTNGPVFLTDRPTEMTALEPAPPVTEESARAFVTDINGRTLITGPAQTIAAMKEPTVEDITAAHMLWMHGRFVGAETPNRNGALWSAGDLEMAKGTVTHGPLNWLHDARHVIGTLAKADYVDPTQGGTQLAAGGPAEPHITATAAIWKWIYPDEAYVVQQASDQQMLWYSMECISKEVSCVGAAGCGNTTSYTDYMAGAACDHVRQRASVRRFVNPVFLGGAVIVPPTRPGWAEADARVLSSANALAETAFEQAGRPDVRASDWEQLMAQLVLFAQN